MDKMVLSVAELAKVMGVSKPIAYELTKQQGFPVIRIGEKRIVIPVEGLKMWLENNCENKKYNYSCSHNGISRKT